MALDRAFCTPTITVDQDKYDDLIKTKTLYLLKLKEEKEKKEMEEKSKLKIMISQPMNGKSEEEIRSERAELVKELEQQGHEVLDTVFSDEYLTKDRPKNCDAGIWALSKSLEVLSQVDGVIFMKGWENARGCKIEHEIAVKYNKFIKEL